MTTELGENITNKIQETKIENLAQKLLDYFGFNDIDGTYIYNLTRVKSAFHIGTMTLDDFEEIDEEFIYELAEYIVSNINAI